MLSLVDVIAFLHQADPQLLRLIKDEIERDLRQRRTFDDGAQTSDGEGSLIRWVSNV